MELAMAKSLSGRRRVNAVVALANPGITRRAMSPVKFVAELSDDEAEAERRLPAGANPVVPAPYTPLLPTPYRRRFVEHRAERKR